MGETPLSVMSFNVRYGTARDGENAWANRRDILVETIRQYDPDVVGTQECLTSQAEYIVKVLPQYHWFGVGREANGSGERMVVFYRKSRISPMESGNFWLSETPDVPGSGSWDTDCNRMTTWARFYHRKTKRFFYFFNTHFDHRSEPARQGAARLMAARIAELPEGTPAIVTGDFNAIAEKSEPWKIITSKDLKDAWLTAAKREGPGVTWGGFEAPKQDSDRRIDWILTRGPVEVQHCETIVFNESGRYPSDHYPVFARLTLTP
jgi:endonuclease/exonuclease/phosphatase family metal-dependent hydrolase